MSDEKQEKIERYQRLTNGMPTTADDPLRGVWYSAKCAYWTDDWTKLDTVCVGGIPSCPRCKSVGFQTTAKDWQIGIEMFEEDNHPRYREFVDAQKERCGPSGPEWFSRYQEFAKRL